jgi:hypothetical protein
MWDIGVPGTAKLIVEIVTSWGQAVVSGVGTPKSLFYAICREAGGVEGLLLQPGAFCIVYREGRVEVCLPGRLELQVVEAGVRIGFGCITSFSTITIVSQAAGWSWYIGWFAHSVASDRRT